MKFLIQKINGKIVHDFSFTLLQTIEFKNWLARGKKEDKVIVKYFDSTSEATDFKFKIIHRHYVPVGTVEFVSSFLNYFYGLTPKPINVPKELFDECFTKRQIFNGNHMDFEDVAGGKYFVKSNDKIKGFAEVIDHKTRGALPLPAGNYQVSQYLNGIESEWRAFVYQGKLIGLQNYAGDFTLFPNPELIKDMIQTYKSAPVAYTLDIGVGRIGDYYKQTVIIEVHDFFSCGLYGFNDVKYPSMLHNWFWQYVQREMVNEYAKNNK